MMSYELAEKIITQIIQLCQKKKHKNLTLIWHGGEPLLWGVNNFKRIFYFINQHCNGLKIKQRIQTNLSLINDEYIRLFKEYNVRIGFSLDGPKSINDTQRKLINGKGTFDVIMKKVEDCRLAGLNIGCILVGSRNFMGKIPEVYDFLCANNLNFKFNPLFCAGEAVNAGTSIAISPEEYAEMAIELFDLWFDDKSHALKETTFIDIASYFVSKTKRSRSCIFAPNCQDSFMAISPTGEVFPCGRFCETDTRYSYGNISTESVDTILRNIQKSEIYARNKCIDESSCSKCKYFQLCHGGCLHDGFLKNGDFKSKTFLCTAYKQIFNHIEQRVSPIIGKNIKLIPQK